MSNETLERQKRTTKMELATLQAERDAELEAKAAQEDRERNIAECHQVIGRIQGARIVADFGDVGSLVWLKQIKESKVYKDIPGIGTWEKLCNSVGLSRTKVDEDLTNLGTLGEKFLTTVGSFNVGYRELRKLKQLTNEGAVIVEAEAVTIGEERIPLDADHADDLQVAIEKILSGHAAAAKRLERLEKEKDAIVKEETKGLKAEVKALVEQVKRLEPFDPQNTTPAVTSAQVKEISDKAIHLTTLVSKLIIADGIEDDPVACGEIEKFLTIAEHVIHDTRKQFQDKTNIYDEF